MCQQRGPFVKLEPADGAVVLQVLGDPGLVDAKVLGKPGTQRFPTTRASLATQQVTHTDPERLARFDVIVGGLIRIGQDEHSGPRRSLVRLINLGQRAGNQSPQLRFQVCKTGGQSRFAGTPAHLPCRRPHRGLYNLSAPCCGSRRRLRRLLLRLFRNSRAYLQSSGRLRRPLRRLRWRGQSLGGFAAATSAASATTATPVARSLGWRYRAFDSLA